MDPKSPEGHLRAASDAIMLLVAEVEQYERHKRGMRPGDDRFYELAKAVRVAALALADFTREEEAWAQAARGREHDVPAIEQAKSPPKLAEILERWRAVERELDNALPESPEAKGLFEDFQRVRDEYMAALRSHEADGSEE